MTSDEQPRQPDLIRDEIQLHEWQHDAPERPVDYRRDDDDYTREQVVDNFLSPTSAGHSSSSSRPSYLSRMHSSDSIKSINSTKSIPGSMIEEIKHEVMVNFLFREQCSSMWVGDGAGELEGVMLRKSKGSYLSCPPQLNETVFGQACSADESLT